MLTQTTNTAESISNVIQFPTRQTPQVVLPNGDELVDIAELLTGGQDGFAVRSSHDGSFEIIDPFSNPRWRIVPVVPVTQVTT